MLRLSLFLTLVLGASCSDDPTPGALGPCDTPAGPLVSCPPDTATDPPPSLEEACLRLVECGVLLLNNENADGNHNGDYTACVNALRGDDVTADRLQYILRCVDVSTCDALAAGHCGTFGGEPPQP